MDQNQESVFGRGAKAEVEICDKTDGNFPCALRVAVFPGFWSLLVLLFFSKGAAKTIFFCPLPYQGLQRTCLENYYPLGHEDIGIRVSHLVPPQLRASCSSAFACTAALHETHGVVALRVWNPPREALSVDEFAMQPWLLLGSILHFCLLWFSGKSLLNR